LLVVIVLSPTIFDDVRERGVHGWWVQTNTTVFIRTNPHAFGLRWEFGERPALRLQTLISAHALAFIDVGPRERAVAIGGIILWGADPPSTVDKTFLIEDLEDTE